MGKEQVRYRRRPDWQILQDSSKTLSGCHHSGSGGDVRSRRTWDGFQMQSSHRICCDLDAIFERGGRFENDSKRFGRIKLPSPETGKAEEEFDKRKKIRIILSHTNLKLRLGICGGVKETVGYIQWSSEGRRFRECPYWMEMRSLRERKGRDINPESVYFHFRAREEKKHWTSGTKEELLRAGGNQKHALSPCHQERGRSHGGHVD